jgi:hypothetical protein
MKNTSNVFKNILPLLTNRKATIGFTVLLCAPLLTATGQAAVFTSDTLIDVGDTTYDGQDIVVSGCTLTANGDHVFLSMALSNNGTLSLGGGSTLTVSAALTVQDNSIVRCQGANTSGQVSNQWAGVGVTIRAASMTVEAGSMVSADGLGYAPSQGPGRGRAIWLGRRRGAWWNGRDIQCRRWSDVRVFDTADRAGQRRF